METKIIYCKNNTWHKKFYIKDKKINIDICISITYYNNTIHKGCYSYIIKNEETYLFFNDWVERKINIYKYFDVYLLIPQDGCLYWEDLIKTQDLEDLIKGTPFLTFNDAKNFVKNDIRRIIENLE